MLVPGVIQGMWDCEVVYGEGEVYGEGVVYVEGEVYGVGVV